MEILEENDETFESIEDSHIREAGNVLASEIMEYDEQVKRNKEFEEFLGVQDHIRCNLKILNSIYASAYDFQDEELKMMIRVKIMEHINNLDSEILF